MSIPRTWQGATPMPTRWCATSSAARWSIPTLTTVEQPVEEMGRLAGVSRQTISQIERGDYSSSVTLALKLAKICQVTVEDIFLPWSRMFEIGLKATYKAD